MRILLIEDSPPTRELLRRFLEDVGYRVEAAARLSSAARLATNQSFDAIVLDVMLPDGSGLDLCRDLRRRGLTTPILVLSAKDGVADRVAGLDAGADDYLRKPFALAELHARLRALARRQGLAPPARMKWDNLLIDFAARRMTRDGDEVPVTAREWGVLECLASRRGRLIERDHLLEEVWGAATAAASDSLDVILSRLRRKLGPRLGSVAIRTVRGRGFVLEGPP
ncbi:MAG TPA: response regulator transcription factor [Candidatus Eisenbacteria bacterium]|jgi:DNA-binding response OmpR family regulator